MDTIESLPRCLGCTALPYADARASHGDVEIRIVCRACCASTPYLASLEEALIAWGQVPRATLKPVPALAPRLFRSPGRPPRLAE